jgi:hypothetical protein
MSFSRIDAIEIEGSKTYHFSLVPLRGRGIPEATCIVVDRRRPLRRCSAGVQDFPQTIIALRHIFDIEIEVKGSAPEKNGRPARS